MVVANKQYPLHVVNQGIGTSETLPNCFDRNGCATATNYWRVSIKFLSRNNSSDVSISVLSILKYRLPTPRGAGHKRTRQFADW